MAALENARHELFCLSILEGKSVTESYRVAGFNDGKPAELKRRASRLRAKPYIGKRIAELLEEAKAKAIVNRDNLSAQVAAHIKQAAADKNWSAVMAGDSLQGRLFGLLTENIAVRDANLPVEKLLADAIAGGIPEAVARRMLGIPNQEPALVIPLKR